VSARGTLFSGVPEKRLQETDQRLDWLGPGLGREMGKCAQLQYCRGSITTPMRRWG